MLTADDGGQGQTGVSERRLQADGLSKINTRGWDAAANERKLSETAAALLVTRY